MLSSIHGLSVGVYNNQIFQLVARRVLQSIPVIFGVTFIVFAILNLLPGGTAESLLGLNATPALVHDLTVRLGLDHPFLDRYFHWLRLAIEGNFGTSLVTDTGGGAGGVPVASIIAQRLPVSAELGGLAFVLALVFAVPVAVLAAKRPKGVVDRANVVVSMFGFSCPQFVFALVMILIFAVHLRIVPAIGFTPLSAGLASNLHSIIMPAVTLAFGIFCGYTRLLRADIVDQMNQEDYIVTARAKGVPPWRILVRHALRNSVFGLITVVSLNIGTLVGGAVIIEQIFGLPGMGQELLQSISNRDITTVQAIVSLLAVTVVCANLVADVLYALLDPRIRYGRPGSWTRPAVDLAAVSDTAQRPATRRALLWANLELILPAAGLIFMVFACFIAPLIFPIAGPNAGNLSFANIAPLSRGHILGTDPLGNDVLSRILYGGRVSIEVGAGSCFLGFVIGGFLGMLAGFKGGVIEIVIMRCLDMFLAIPALILAITIATFLGASELHVIWAISFFSVPGFARLSRAHTLRLREQIFMVSSKLSGQKDRVILIRHLAPNVIPNMLTFSFIFIGIAILVEAALSFLGFGVPPPQPSWGNMIYQGQSYLASNPDLVLIPAAFLFFTVMCLNLFGDALRSRWSMQ